MLSKDTLFMLACKSYIIQSDSYITEDGGPTPITEYTTFQLDNLGIAEVEKAQWFNVEFFIKTNFTSNSNCCCDHPAHAMPIILAIAIPIKLPTIPDRTGIPHQSEIFLASAFFAPLLVQLFQSQNQIMYDLLHTMDASFSNQAEALEALKDSVESQNSAISDLEESLDSIEQSIDNKSESVNTEPES